MRLPPTWLELVVAIALVGVGIIVGEILTARHFRPRGLPFDPRCWR